MTNELNGNGGDSIDLSNHTVITFEINNECNLRNVHKECPINTRKYVDTRWTLTDNSILEGIREAKKLNFTGYIGFHYYNEPMLELNRILNIIHRSPDTHFLLWTNGTMLDRKIDNNRFLEKFSGVVVSCYNEDDLFFLQYLQDYYPNLQINNFKLDRRLDIYHNTTTYSLGCKRPLCELPIDHYGNVHLCCMDWNNSYMIGNILQTSLTDVIRSSSYQNILKQASKRWLTNESPSICRKCFKRLARYSKSDYIRIEENL